MSVQFAFASCGENNCRGCKPGLDKKEVNGIDVYICDSPEGACVDVIGGQCSGQCLCVPEYKEEPTMCLCANSEVPHSVAFLLEHGKNVRKLILRHVCVFWHPVYELVSLLVIFDEYREHASK